MNIDMASLGSVMTAIGALGLAAFALVDTTKTLPGGGVSNFGFAFVEAAVKLFVVPAPDSASAADQTGSLLYTLHANWIGGMAAPDQKAVAKSLIKLRLTPETAAQYAAVTQVEPQALAQVAQRMTTGAALDAQQGNALGRFDLALTAILDAAYQRADQRYRNASRSVAALASVALAGFGGYVVNDPQLAYAGSPQMWLALFCGVLAVPLAPISKDLTSALSAGVKLAQTLRR